MACRNNNLSPDKLTGPAKWMPAQTVFIIWTLSTVSACQSYPGTLQSWSAVNNTQKTQNTQTMQTTQNVVSTNQIGSAQRVAIKTAEVAAQPKSLHLSGMALQQAISQLVPADYRLDIEDDLNLETPLKVDVSKNWLEALGQAMAEANIEFVANLYQKSATVKWNKMTLAQVVEQYLPADFTVYSESGIDLQSLVHFDPRQYWAEALRLSTVDHGVDLTINYTGKIIALRPAGVAGVASTATGHSISGNQSGTAF